jgi:chromosome segregation ATPase
VGLTGPAFEVEEFEYVDAGPELALVRLSGVWQSGEPEDEVGLVAWLRGERIPLSPLPAPPSGEGGWRAAFSAPPSLLADPAAEFELEPAGGPPVILPAPVEHGAVVEPGPELEVEVAPVVVPEPERERPRLFGRRRASAAPFPADSALHAALRSEREARQAAEREAAEERARAQRAEAMLQDELRSTVGKTDELLARIDSYDRSRISFEEELDAVRRTHADLLAEAREEHALELHALRAELDTAREELEVALSEAGTAKDHVDTLNEAHGLELGAARSQRDAAEQRARGLEEQLAAERSALEEVRAQLEEREELIERARSEAALASSESAELQESVTRLRDAITARARDTATAATRRFSRAPGESLDRSRDELRRDAERIAALERQAEALRDAIHSQLPYSLHASPLQEALPLDPEAEESG